MVSRPPGETGPARPDPDRIGRWFAQLLGRSEDRPLPERLEQLLLGGPRRYTRADVQRLSGVDPERTRRLWRALGFADVDDDERVFTDVDLQALALIDEFVGSGLIEPAIESAAARAAGQSLSRLADWEVGLLTDYVQSHVETRRDVDDAMVLRFAENVLPVMEQLHSYIWRRHLAAISGRMLASSADELERGALVVGFADVVGYTSLSRELGEAELIELIERFESMASDIVVTAGGRVVKTLGDEVLFVADEPINAAVIALHLIDGTGADDDLPDLRIGLALGEVVSRFGDVYGPVVNIASRLTSAARPGTILVDRELASALEAEPRVRLHRRRTRSVRGYHRLAAWRLDAAPPQPPGQSSG
jgi:adenylate cyclase